MIKLTVSFHLMKIFYKLILIQTFNWVGFPFVSLYYMSLCSKMNWNWCSRTRWHGIYLHKNWLCLVLSGCGKCVYACDSVQVHMRSIDLVKNVRAETIGMPWGMRSQMHPHAIIYLDKSTETSNGRFRLPIDSHVGLCRLPSLYLKHLEYE